MVLAALSTAPTYDYVLEPGAQPVIEALMPVPDGAPKGTAATGAKITRDHARFTYTLPGSKTVYLDVRHAKAAQAGDDTTATLSLRSDLPTDHPLRRAFLARLKTFDARLNFRPRVRRGEISNPLKVARASLYMLDAAGVATATQAALQADPDDPNLRMEVALLLKAAGNERASSAQEKEARQRLGSNPGALPTRLALDALHGLPDADAMNRVLARGSEGACGLSRVADAHYVLGRYKEALKVVDDILRAAPACTDAHYLGAEVTARSFQWQALLERSEAAAKILGDPKKFTIHRATALRGLKRYDEARDIIEKVVRANPQSSGALAMLTNLYNLTLTKQDVYQDLKQRYERNPNDIVSHYLAGVMAHYLGHHQACADILEPLIPRMPLEPRVAMYAAVSAHFAGEQARAERLIKVSTSIAGAMDPDVFYCRSIIIRRQDIPQAIADLERFLTVAKFGWHSDGKIDRVKGELALLKKGIIPPPAESHHRLKNGQPILPLPEGAERPSPDSAPAQTSATRDDDVGVWGSPTQGALALGVLTLLLFLAWRRVAAAGEDA